jgi:pimeloyl-ACP methyl ester carboxylesterase
MNAPKVPGTEISAAMRSAATRLALALWLPLALLPVPAGASEHILLNDDTPALSGRLTPSPEWPIGHTVLLLHGTFSHRDTEIIQSLEQLLSDAGATTLAINLSLGTEARDGPFPCDSEHRHRDGDALRELGRWMAWLEDQGAADITLLGHSRGSNQIARFAAEAENPRIHRLILVAPPRWSAESTRAAYRSRHGGDLDAALAMAAAQIADGRGGELLPQPVGLHYCDDASVSADSFLSYYREDPLRDTAAVLAALSLPVLVVTGSEDDVVPDMAADLVGGGSNVSVVEIDGADHFFRDLYADELVDHALEFLGL